MGSDGAGRVDVARAVTLVTVDVWRELLSSRGLSRRGLALVHDRLVADGVLVPCPQLDLLKLDVEQALADAYGLSREDVPDAEPVPDAPGDIPPPEQRPW